MVDFVKILNACINEESLINNNLLNFTQRYDMNTGEVIPGSRKAKYRGMTFCINSNGVVSIYGSLHKYFNCGEHNYNDFTFGNLLEVLKDLENRFGLDLSGTELNNIEFGVNIEVPLNPDDILNSLVTHVCDQFSFEKGENKTYYQVKYEQYIIKVYNKGLQYQVPGNILRFEVKILRMKKIEKYHIKTLHDLTIPENLSGIKNLLLDTFSGIVFYDRTIDLSSVNDRDREILRDGSNPKFWKKHYEKAGSNASKRLRRYQKLVKEHGSLKLDSIRDLINKKWDSLLNDREVTVRDLTDLEKRTGHETVRDLTGLEKRSIRETVRDLTGPEESRKVEPVRDLTGTLNGCEKKDNTSFNILGIEGNLVNPKSPERKCIVTGIDISMQKDGSRFLSTAGIKYLYLNNRDLFNTLLSELPAEFQNASLERQVQKIRQHIKDQFFNPRNSVRRSIKKICSEKLLFDNSVLISKEKMAIAKTP